jgi:hypothetical protein
MRKLVTIAVLAAFLLAAWPVPSHANGAVAAALALSAFAAFTTLVAAPLWAGYAWYPPYYYSAPPVVYAPSTYASAPAYTPPVPAPAIQREVVYAEGRYLLFGDGVTRAYQWVWVPNPPPPGSAPPPS